ncbi:uncharacterized protein LODBEIA_P32990 [Lodderomyces beijingensis]|uniref:Uncharacterized protein n=1 Tax=Lodderomyces beijingensis TaxID=1775926 RepID=A0ABP0ZS89_9ASCO
MYYAFFTTLTCVLSVVLYKLYESKSSELKTFRKELDQKLVCAKRTSDSESLQLKKELDEAKRQLKESSDRSDKELHELQHQLDELRKQNRVVQQRESEEKQRYSKVVAQGKSSDSEVSNLQKSLNEAKQQLQKAEQEFKFNFNKKMESVIVEKDSRIAELEQKLANHERALTKEQQLALSAQAGNDQALRDLQKKHSDAQEHWNKVQLEMDHHVAENNRYIKLSDTQKKDIEDLEEKYRNMNSDYIKITRDLEHSEQVVIDAEKLAEDLKLAHKLLNSQLVKEKELKEGLVSRVEALERKVQEKIKFTDRLTEELATQKELQRRFVDYALELKKDPGFPQSPNFSAAPIDLENISSDEDDRELDEHYNSSNQQSNSNNSNNQIDIEKFELKPSEAKDIKTKFNQICAYINHLKVELSSSRESDLQKGLEVENLKKEVSQLVAIKNQYLQHMSEEITKNCHYDAALRQFQSALTSVTSLSESDDVVQSLQNLLNLNQGILEYNREAEERVQAQESCDEDRTRETTTSLKPQTGNINNKGNEPADAKGDVKPSHSTGESVEMSNNTVNEEEKRSKDRSGRRFEALDAYSKIKTDRSSKPAVGGAISPTKEAVSEHENGVAKGTKKSPREPAAAHGEHSAEGVESQNDDIKAGKSSQPSVADANSKSTVENQEKEHNGVIGDSVKPTLDKNQIPSREDDEVETSKNQDDDDDDDVTGQKQPQVPETSGGLIRETPAKKEEAEDNKSLSDESKKELGVGESASGDTKKPITAENRRNTHDNALDAYNQIRTDRLSKPALGGAISLATSGLKSKDSDNETQSTGEDSLKSAAEKKESTGATASPRPSNESDTLSSIDEKLKQSLENESQEDENPNSKENSNSNANLSSGGDFLDPQKEEQPLNENYNLEAASSQNVPTRTSESVDPVDQSSKVDLSENVQREHERDDHQADSKQKTHDQSSGSSPGRKDSFSSAKIGSQIAEKRRKNSEEHDVHSQSSNPKTQPMGEALTNAMSDQSIKENAKKIFEQYQLGLKD